MGTAVDAVGSLSWSSLLAQCTHPSAKGDVGAKGSQLSVFSEELPLAEPGAAWPSRFFQGVYQGAVYAPCPQGWSLTLAESRFFASFFLLPYTAPHSKTLLRVSFQWIKGTGNSIRLFFSGTQVKKPWEYPLSVVEIHCHLLENVPTRERPFNFLCFVLVPCVVQSK